ncbi:MAG: hypothetical protein P8L18_01290 [Verrucomicrobiota bacterium]|nr:hypothetical protein [Verrucomicrobiota bacterium]
MRYLNLNTQPNEAGIWAFHFCLLSLILLAGCRQDAGIQVYSVPKRSAYKLPANWTPSENSSAMRLATFEVKGNEGTSAEMAILPMPDLQVGDHEIVNLWRQQLQLEPITEDQVEASSEVVKIGNYDGRIFDLTAPESVPGEVSGLRIITAFVRAPIGTWFFKMSGNADHLERERSAFVDFLSSVSLPELQEQMQESRSASAPQPAMGSSAPPASRSNPPPADAPSWNVPDGWVPEGARSMVLASFRATGEGGEVSITVSRLGGGAGGLLPNINRWCGQVGMEKITEAGLSKIKENIQCSSGEKGTLVALPGDTEQINAVILPREGQTWFFKAMGPKAAVQRESASFRSFIQTVKF